MKKLLLTLLLLALAAASATGQTGAKYILTNDTGTTGGSFFPVTTLVTFQSISVTETFADAFTATLPLFISNVQTTSLTPFQLSAATKATDIAAHGGVVTTTVSGLFSRTNWQTASTAGGAKTAVTVLSSFSSTLNNPTTNSLTSVYGTDSTSGALYRAGQFNTQAATLPATPEPGAFAGAAVAFGLFAISRRRRSK